MARSSVYVNIKKRTLQARSSASLERRRWPAHSFTTQETQTARGSKATYTKKQGRQARHIEKSYEKRGVSKKTAKARAWATVNKEDKGGKKSGSGRGKTSTRTASRKGGRKGAAARSTASRSAAAKKAARTRKRRGS